MTYHEAVTKLIMARVSSRSYLTEPIEVEKKIRLTDAFSSLKVSPFGGDMSFHLVENRERENGNHRLGTYGMIKNPPCFLFGVMKRSRRAFVSYGYLFEQIILKATELGLGTCWLGYFRKGTFQKKIQVKEDEILPAVSPVGYASSQRGFYDLYVQKTVKPRRRNAWKDLFFLEDPANPLTPARVGAYASPLEMVRMAPSAGNLQPWRVIKEKEENRFHFCLDHAASKRSYDKLGLPYIDMGIAMCHFELSATEKNLNGNWEQTLPDTLSLLPDMEYIVTWHAKN